MIKKEALSGLRMLAKTRGLYNRAAGMGIGKKMLHGAAIGAAGGAMTADPENGKGIAGSMLSGATMGAVGGGLFGMAKPMGGARSVKGAQIRAASKAKAVQPVKPVPNPADVAFKKQQMDTGYDDYMRDRPMDLAASSILDELYMEKKAAISDKAKSAYEKLKKLPKAYINADPFNRSMLGLGVGGAYGAMKKDTPEAQEERRKEKNLVMKQLNKLHPRLRNAIVYGSIGSALTYYPGNVDAKKVKKVKRSV